MSFKEIKSEAKKLYKGNVSKCAGAEFASFVIKYTPLLAVFTVQFLCMQRLGDGYNGVFSGLFGLLYLAATVFVCLPTTIGTGMYFTAKTLKRNPVIDKIFCAYKNWHGKCASAAIPLGILIAENVVGSILSYAAYRCLGNIGAVVSAAIILLEIIAVIYTLAAYAPLTYVLETYSDISVGMTIGKTLRVSSKNRGKIVGFYLSFILWILLGIVTLGIGFVWIMPYIRLSSRVLFGDLDKG